MRYQTYFIYQSNTNAISYGNRLHFPHMNTSRKLYHNNMSNLEKTFVSLIKTYQLVSYE